MPTIPLDRRFLGWSKELENTDPDAILRFGRSTDPSDWADISERRRLVILAEAGAGKTEEMREQARWRIEAGQFAFFATVEDVAADGLEGALPIGDRRRLQDWRASNETAWFFIDSIDEAKLGRVRLDRAIRRIAEGIVGGERRAHVALSCRVTDWDATRDLAQLSEGLPVPRDPSLPPPPTADELLVGTLRREQRRGNGEPLAEKPLVVLMAPLDPERVRIFAAAHGAADLDALLDQIERANLWRFARRPLDLDWLVRYWRAHGRLGTLAEMLESSLNERITETNPDRVRADRLNAERARHALQRVGSALVFGRKATIAIPDSELLRPDDLQPLDLAQVLPDWSADDRLRLLSRPVFDPATFGRARLHNDNEEIVRGYLAAQWLYRLRKDNLSRHELFDLLFATTYEIDLIKPSMQETAAWLAIWDEEVGREVALRDPSLLLTAGDPASLTTAVREAVLTDVIGQLAGDGPRLRLLDYESIKRFSRPDLVGVIRRLWSTHQDKAPARELLLRLIWLGGLRDCADLAEATAYSGSVDRHTMILAGRALTATSDDPAKRRYVEFIKRNGAGLPPTLSWEAIDDLFPRLLDVGDLLEILGQVDITDSDGGLSFAWRSSSLIDRLQTRGDFEQLLSGLLAQLGPEPGDIGHVPNDREEAYIVAIAAAACRLLELSGPDEVPPDTIDAALRIGVSRRYARSIHEIRDVPNQLHRTASRRRLAFWRAATQRDRHPWLQRRAIEHPWEIEVFGYQLGLQLEDVAWLIEDAPHRTGANERKLAINVAMGLWRQAHSPPALLAEIERVAQLDEAMSGAYDLWLNLPPPSAQQIAHDREMKKLGDQAEVERAARDKAWLEFVEELRKDPAQLRNVKPPSAEGVDTRLYHLWSLLSDTVDASMRYAIDTVAPIEPMVGADLAAELRDGLIRHWRLWQPTLKSAKTAEERNRIFSSDCMGITGISLEAGTRPEWAAQLTSAEATLAAGYATLELNGFPSWLSTLAAAKPTEVRDLLIGEVAVELDDPEPRQRYDVLEDLSRAEEPIVELLAPALLAELEHRGDIPPRALEPSLEIIRRGLNACRSRAAAFALGRFDGVGDPLVAGLYLGLAFAADAEAATAALINRLDTLDAAGKTALAQHVLPGIFGSDFRANFEPPDLSFATLELLVHTAFHTIRHEDDHNRPSGQVFSSDDRAMPSMRGAWRLTGLPTHPADQRSMRCIVWSAIPTARCRRLTFINWRGSVPRRIRRARPGHTRICETKVFQDSDRP